MNLKDNFRNVQIVVFRDLVATRRHWFNIFINHLISRTYGAIEIKKFDFTQDSIMYILGESEINLSMTW